MATDVFMAALYRFARRRRQGPKNSAGGRGPMPARREEIVNRVGANLQIAEPERWFGQVFGPNRPSCGTTGRKRQIQGISNGPQERDTQAQTGQRQRPRQPLPGDRARGDHRRASVHAATQGTTGLARAEIGVGGGRNGRHERSGERSGTERRAAFACATGAGTGLRPRPSVLRCRHVRAQPPPESGGRYWQPC